MLLGLVLGIGLNLFEVLVLSNLTDGPYDLGSGRTEAFSENS